MRNQGSGRSGQFFGETGPRKVRWWTQQEVNLNLKKTSNFTAVSQFQWLTFFNPQGWCYPRMTVIRNVWGTIALRFIFKCEVCQAWHLHCWLRENVRIDNQRDCWRDWGVVVLSHCVVVLHLFSIDLPSHRRNPIAPDSNLADHAHNVVLNNIIYSGLLHFFVVQLNLTDWICSWICDEN